MRITTGALKGRKLIVPKGIRPTQEKVRKAFFDILGDISGFSFLELFAGSGAVGFEALSRGAARVVFVECARDCVAAIKRNAESLKAESCFLYPIEAGRALDVLRAQKSKFDIIFLDPPYSKIPAFHPGSGSNSGPSGKKILQTLSGCDILADGGLVVAQHFKKDDLPDSVGDLALLKRKKYGTTLLSVYKKEF